MKKNGFISKQLQKMLAPVIDRCLHVCYDLVEKLISKEFSSYDDYTNLIDKIDSYSKFEVYILDQLKGDGIDG